MSVQPNRCILGGDADVATPFTRELLRFLDEGGRCGCPSSIPR